MMIEPMISITATRVTGVRAQGYTMPWVPDDDKALAASGGGERARLTIEELPTLFCPGS